MILVLETDAARPTKLCVRVVLDPGEMPPASLLELRVLLRRAIEDLPRDIRDITVIPDRRRPNDNDKAS